jgi:hypothetical protein
MARKTRAQRMSAGPKNAYHGKSIKNGATYQALRRKRHMSKSRAAAISNGVLNKGYRRGIVGGRKKK